MLLAGRTKGYMNDSRVVYVATGLNEPIGGSGMRKFYDQIVPLAMRQAVKSLGGDGLRVIDIGKDAEVSRLDVRGEARGKGRAEEQMGFDITPEMRSALRGGLPLFGFAVDDLRAERDPWAERATA